MRANKRYYAKVSVMTNGYWRIVTTESKDFVLPLLSKFSLCLWAHWQIETNLLVLDVSGQERGIENFLHSVAGKDLTVFPISRPGFVSSVGDITLSWLGRPSSKEIVIEPQGIFGSGLHPTTSLVISLFEKLFQTNIKPKNILDFGTGSGILALISARLWPEASIFAIDVDFSAAKQCQANAKRNNLAQKIRVACGTSDAISKKFDLVIANVYLRVLTQEAHNLKNLLAANGIFLFSGFLSESQKLLLNCYPGYRLLYSQEKDGWQALVLKR